MSRRNLAVCVTALAGVLAVMSVSQSATPPLGFSEAARAFAGLPTEKRVREQLMLAATGYWLAVPTGSFGEHMFDGIKRFQLENGFPQTGILNGGEFERLNTLSDANFRMWGFRKVRHPARNLSVWIPYGLELTTERNEYGLNFKDNQKRVLIDFTTVPNVFISDNFLAIVTMMQRESAKINYKVFKDDWFVISATGADGVDHYLRYHQDADNVTGFTLSWNNANGDVHGERIATLMSASLWADTVGPWTIDPPVIPPTPPANQTAVVVPPVAPLPEPSAPATARPEPSPKPAPGSPAEAETRTTFQSGTGFFVGEDGTLLTNAHVVHDCSDIRVRAGDGNVMTATVKRVDEVNDLALIKADFKPPKVVTFRIGARLGEGVEAFGFPHSDILASSGNFTLGNITALSGLGDDSRYYQISVPVQSGNSGGPLFDQSGNVVGIVTAKLNALKVALEDGDLPQNVNFAVKASLIAAFLDSNQITPQIATSGGKAMESPDIADQARAVSGFVICPLSK